MKILLTGANGYIGKRILPALIMDGHEIICCVRDRRRLDFILDEPNVEVWEHDFQYPVDISEAPTDIDAAYFLIHSMSSSVSGFYNTEALVANQFKDYIDQTNARQIIYLSGITNQEKLSSHLASRKNVENILSNSMVPLTTLKAGIIVGSGSASFEIMRDLVEKLPVMIAPKWLNTLSQPIAIKNVIEYLHRVLLMEDTYNKSLDIGGPDIMTYKTMLLKLAHVRKLPRYIITVPVMTPRLSSYWLYFVTSISYKLAVNLVNSLKVNILADDKEIRKLISIDLIPYEEAVRQAYEILENKSLISSWKDSLISSMHENRLNQFLDVPSSGCFKEIRELEIKQNNSQVLENIWSIGGERGWYYANFLWKVRGFIDRMAGGVGLRRGRTNKNTIHTGDVIDFWRVILADKKEKRLLLYAEMKVPGEAWLEFKIKEKNNKEYLIQTATFRPHGVAGRLYWFLLWPIHVLIFKGMIKQIANFKP